MSSSEHADSQSEVDWSERAAPVRPGVRLHGLDLIRGIAVLGILLANVMAFGQPDVAYYWPPGIVGGMRQSDAWVWLVQFVAIDGKFRGIFAILFGAGMVLFVDRFGDYERALGLQARRLLWLLLFGLLHFALLFQGDILFTYASAGLIALFAVPLAPRVQLGAGIAWALLGGLFRFIAYLPAAAIEQAGLSGRGDPAALASQQDYWQQRLARAAEEAAYFSGDSYLAILRHRVTEQYDALASFFVLNFYETIPLMLIGMGLLRLGMFAPRQKRDRWPLLGWAGVALGTAINLAGGLYAMRQGFPPFTTQLVFFGVSLLGNLPLLVGGMALLGRWAAKMHDGWLVERLTGAGRMAFSNYVLTSLVMVLLFHGWAGGLFATLHRIEMLAAVALGWAVMIAFSRLWLARFRYGPLEYLWRCLTYWQVFPNRLPS